MIELTRELNAKYFEGRTEVTCFTCHQGNVHPASTVPLGSIIVPTETEPKTETQPNSISVDSILTKYLDALGSATARNKLKSRHIIGKRVEPDGRTEPEEVWQLSDGRFRMLTTYGTPEKPVAVVEGFDGKTAWKKANADVIQLKADEAALIELDAKATLVSDLHTVFQDLRFRKTIQLEGRSATLDNRLCGKGFASEPLLRHGERTNAAPHHCDSNFHGGLCASGRLPRVQSLR